MYLQAGPLGATANTEAMQEHEVCSMNYDVMLAHIFTGTIRVLFFSRHEDLDHCDSLHDWSAAPAARHHLAQDAQQLPEDIR